VESHRQRVASPNVTSYLSVADNRDERGKSVRSEILDYSPAVHMDKNCIYFHIYNNNNSLHYIHHTHPPSDRQNILQYCPYKISCPVSSSMIPYASQKKIQTLHIYYRTPRLVHFISHLSLSLSLLSLTFLF